MMRKPNSFFIFFDLIMVLVFSLYYVLPSVQERISFIIPLMISMPYIIIVTWNDDRKTLKEFTAYIILIVFISLLYTFFTETNSIASYVSNTKIKRFLSKFYQLYSIYFPIFITKRVILTQSINTMRFIGAIIPVILAYVIYQTMSELSFDINATKHWDNFSENALNNVAGYHFIYAIPFTTVTSVYFLIKAKPISHKVLSFIMIIFQVIFLFKSQYALSIIICFLGIIDLIFVLVKDIRKRFLIIGTSTFAIVTTPFLIDSIIKSIDSEHLQIRLNELYSFIFSGNTSGYNLSSRLTLYSDSIKAFFKSPIFGNRYVEFDGHATFLTVLSDIGLIGGIPFFYLFYKSRKIIESVLTIHNQFFNPMYFMLILMGFTNPIHSSLPLNYACWFIAPLFILITEHGNNNNKYIDFSGEEYYD